MPALAVSVALLGLACAQPASAASRSPGASGNPCDEIPISAEAGYLNLCYYSDTYFTVDNVPGDDDDEAYFVFLAATYNPGVTLSASRPISQVPVADGLNGLNAEVRLAVVDLDGKVSTGIARLLGSPTADRVAVAPGQTLTVRSESPLTTTDVDFGYDRAAAFSAVVAGSLAENIVLQHLSEDARTVHEMAECVEYIRHWIANGNGGKVASGSLVARVWTSGWNGENGYSECQSFRSFFVPDETPGTKTGANEDEDNNKSEWHKLWDAAKDTFKDVAPDVPHYFDNPGNAR